MDKHHARAVVFDLGEDLEALMHIRLRVEEFAAIMAKAKIGDQLRHILCFALGFTCSFKIICDDQSIDREGIAIGYIVPLNGRRAPAVGWATMVEVDGFWGVGLCAQNARFWELFILRFAPLAPGASLKKSVGVELRAETVRGVIGVVAPNPSVHACDGHRALTRLLFFAGIGFDHKRVSPVAADRDATSQRDEQGERKGTPKNEF